MDLHQFFTGSRMVVVAGKGGVGKTTVSAAVACAAARSGRRTLLVDLQDSATLAAAFGRTAPFGHRPVSLWAADDGPGSLNVRTIDPSTALAEYLDQHGLSRVSKRLVTTGVVDVVATAAPGIEDLLVLGKLKQLEVAGESDLIVVDGPPAGHAVQFLLAAARLRDAVSSGPIATQADDVLAMLADPQRCEVILVTLPETTPVNELVETAAALEQQAGVRVRTAVVNAVDEGPAAGGAVDEGRAGSGTRDEGRAGSAVGGRAIVAGDHLPRAVQVAAAFRTARRARHAAEVARLGSLAPGLTVHRLPLMPSTSIGPAELARLAEVVAAW